MKQAQSLVLALLIFLVPSNLFLKLSLENVYIRGILVDYLIPKFYLSDLVLLLFIALTVLQNNFLKSFLLPKNIFNWAAIFLIGIISINQAYTSHPTAAFFTLLSLLKIILLFICLQKSAFIYKSAWISWALIGSILFQSSLGLYQLFTQQELAGYWLLGEPALSYSLGLAREQVGTVEQLLPYGTTAHPNVLGGILSAYLLMLIIQLPTIKTRQKRFQAGYWTAIGLGSLTLWATHSLAAWLALLIGLAVLVGARKVGHTLSVVSFIGILTIATLLTPLGLQQLKGTTAFIPSSSVERRLVLNEVATQMLQAHPIRGIGLNQFTVQLEKYTSSREVVRFIQPVHSVGWLWAAETGLVGLSLIGLLVYQAWRKRLVMPSYLLLFVPLAVLDHYLLTLQSGLLLVVITATFFIHFTKEK